MLLGVPLVTIASLSLLVGASLGLWLFGSRFARRYRDLHGATPPYRWLFTRTDDPELEHWRRPALAVLPVYLIALVLYLSRP
jgi:hypothetical protein